MAGGGRGRVLGQHPGVADVAVSSRPDPEWGERLVACVVPRDPAAPPPLGELRALVRDQLAAYAAPKEVVLVHSLPRTSIGKLRRDEVRRQLEAVRGAGGQGAGPGGAGPGRRRPGHRPRARRR